MTEDSPSGRPPQNTSAAKRASETGLDLLVTQKIAQEQGGTLSMETEPDRGSLFRITLPREKIASFSASETGPGEA